jgi:glycosyltransferase involved in cell wall biosynthesis
LRILILHRKDITHPEAGGGTFYIHKIAKFLTKSGHDVTIICANYPGGSKDDNIDGVNILRLGNEYSVYPLAIVRFLRRFRSKINVLIDVINGPPWFSPLYTNIPKIAVIFQTFKEVFLEELNKPLAAALSSVEKVISHVYQKIPMVTLSSSVKMELVSMGVMERNIFVIPPGIEQEKYSLGRKSSRPLVLYVGRLKKYKGIEYLIMAMKEVIKEIVDVRLLIVGKGNYADELMKLTEKMELENVVEFCGYVSEERKVAIMQRAHVLVIPSIKEGWGIPVIEAGACGTPAIGTQTSGLMDTIIDGKTGFLAPYGKPKIIAEKIVSVLKNDDLRDRLSKNALEWAKNFDWKNGLYRFERIVTSIGKNRLQQMQHSASELIA